MPDDSSQDEFLFPNEDTGIRAVDELESGSRDDQSSSTDTDHESANRAENRHWDSSMETSTGDRPLGQMLEPSEPDRKHPNDALWWKVLRISTPVYLFGLILWPLLAVGVFELTSAGTPARVAAGGGVLCLIALLVFFRAVVLPGALLRDISLINHHRASDWNPSVRWYLFTVLLAGGPTTVWYLGERSRALDTPAQEYAPVSQLQAYLRQTNQRALFAMGLLDLAAVLLVIVFGALSSVEGAPFIVGGYQTMLALVSLTVLRLLFLPRVLTRTMGEREDGAKCQIRCGFGVVFPLLLGAYARITE